MPSVPPLVSLRGVRKTVLEGARLRTVLDGVDLDVASGEAVAVLGRSGSGKSTLLNLIAGIDDADAPRGSAQPPPGTIVTCGVDVGRADERTRAQLRRERLGFVFQAFHLLPTLTVAENVALPLELAGTRTSAAAPRVAELLARVGLADRAGAWPDVLSGGERQRTALARALATRPRLVLCDEPTGNLDDATADVVLALLDELRRAEHCALIVVTHAAKVAARCDRRLWLEGGVLREARGGEASA